MKIICQSENVAQYIKSIILKYASYVDSRLELYDMGSCRPIITTQITITDDESYIMFGRGTSGCWSSTDDRATIKKRIDFEEIKSVIDFLLEDYRFINNIMFYNDTGYGSRVELIFSINWTNESIKQGAIREIKEETGCDVELNGILYIANRILEDDLFVMIIFSTKLINENIKNDKSEILDAQWFSYDEIMNQMDDKLRKLDYIKTAVSNHKNNIIGTIDLINTLE